MSAICIIIRDSAYENDSYYGHYFSNRQLKNLWANERLLNVIEQLIGPEIAGHPLWNLRTKTPQNEATTVPWHQGRITVKRRITKLKAPNIIVYIKM